MAAAFAQATDLAGPAGAGEMLPALLNALAAAGVTVGMLEAAAMPLLRGNAHG